MSFPRTPPGKSEKTHRKNHSQTLGKTQETTEKTQRKTIQKTHRNHQEKTIEYTKVETIEKPRKTIEKPRKTIENHQKIPGNSSQKGMSFSAPGAEQARNFIAAKLVELRAFSDKAGVVGWRGLVGKFRLFFGFMFCFFCVSVFIRLTCFFSTSGRFFFIEKSFLVGF